MGKGIRYTDEFKRAAVNQIVTHGYPLQAVSHRLGISTRSLYFCVKFKGSGLWISIFPRNPAEE